MLREINDLLVNAIETQLLPILFIKHISGNYLLELKIYESYHIVQYILYHT